jgi:hypothetical protein
MTELVPAKNTRGAKSVRLSDDELHRAACECLHKADFHLFSMLPSVLAQIIEYKAWKSRVGFRNFGEYALSHTSEGLRITNNQRLWLLRCSLDVHGKHVKEWAEVLAEVEKAVKISVREEGWKVRDLSGNSLENLGKACADPRTQKITYLPSRNRDIDGHLIRLRRNAPNVYRRVISGQITVREGVREAGMQRKDSDINRDPVDRAIMYIQRMKRADIRRLVEWLREEGHVK